MTEFVAKVQKSRRVVIPGGVYKAMELAAGDELLVNITKKVPTESLQKLGLQKLRDTEHGQ